MHCTKSGKVCRVKLNNISELEYLNNIPTPIGSLISITFKAITVNPLGQNPNPFSEDLKLLAPYKKIRVNGFFAIYPRRAWIDYFIIGFNYRNIKLIDYDYISQYHNFIILRNTRFKQFNTINS